MLKAVVLVSLLGSVAAWAQDQRLPTPAEGSVDLGGRFNPAAPPTNHISSEADMRARVTIEPAGKDRLKIGEVLIDVTNRVVMFPATVNMDEGIVEYAVVHTSGKTHEAIFATKSRPEEVHLGCLLLGATNPPAQVTVEVTWEKNGPPARYRLEDLVVASNRPLTQGAWRYSGSMFVGPDFMASAEGSIISVISDSGALVENTRPEAPDDTAHSPSKDRLPDPGYPVRIEIHVPSANGK